MKVPTIANTNITELVEVQNKQVVTTSLKVAEVFEKQHKHVIEAIENIKAENSALTSFFYEGTYKAGTGKSYKMYYMNRDGLHGQEGAGLENQVHRGVQCDGREAADAEAFPEPALSDTSYQDGGQGHRWHGRCHS